MSTISPAALGAQSPPSSATNAPAKPAETGSAKTSPLTAESSQTTLKTSAPPSRDEVNQAVDRANKALENTSSNQFQFSIDKDTGIDVIKLVDQQTGEIIQQFPSKEMLAIAQSLDQTKGGALIKLQV